MCVCECLRHCLCVCCSLSTPARYVPLLWVCSVKIEGVCMCVYR